jgi:hypothetical protein
MNIFYEYLAINLIIFISLNDSLLLICFITVDYSITPKQFNSLSKIIILILFH